MKISDLPLDAIESQAATWLVRRDGSMTAAEKEEFDRWCKADPRHADAVREIAAMWMAFDRPAETGRINSLRSELQALARRDRRRWIAGGTAVMLAAAACLTLYIGLPQSRVTRPSAATVSSSTIARVVEPERQILSDGSVVELKHGAKIRVAFSDEKRVVILEKGEAHFSVTKNPQRPFIVETGTVKVSAVGTAFAVGLGQKEIEVLVTEGRVRVDSSLYDAQDQTTSPDGGLAGIPALAPMTPMVEAGQRAVVALGTAAPVAAIVPVSEAEFNERLSWRLPRLEFSETSLREATAMFNRYNQLQLHVADDSVANRRITGIFRSDNVQGFMRAVESAFDLRVEQQGRDVYLRRAK